MYIKKIRVLKNLYLALSLWAFAMLLVLLLFGSYLSTTLVAHTTNTYVVYRLLTIIESYESGDK